MKKYIILGSTMLLTPAIALAAGLADVIATVGGLINLLVPVVISAAVLFFLYGLAVYMWSVGDKKEDGKDMMIWGVIGLFVMVSVWGLVNLLSDTFNLDTTAQPIPTLPTQ
jgi:uncharacterized membrane-anchored protein